VLSAATAVLLAVPATAQQGRPGGGGGGALMGELVKDIEQVQEKLVGLARVIPADKWSWTPGEGVRSVGAVFMHVAADNYLLPAPLGTAAPASTMIKADDYSTVQAFENKVLSKEATIAELERSFAHLKTALQGASAMGEGISMFGQSFTRMGYLLLVTTHLHEHLGQMIAYARSNGVVPPWSRGGN
jgi:uncharacterized damage-inducible protein DinB